MTKSKILGIGISITSVVLIILIIVYTIFFSAFGLRSGGSIFTLLPLWMFSFVQITLASFFLYFGIKQFKKK
jgi:hypothetical protein